MKDFPDAQAVFLEKFDKIKKIEKECEKNGGDSTQIADMMEAAQSLTNLAKVIKASLNAPGEQKNLADIDHFLSSLHKTVANVIGAQSLEMHRAVHAYLTRKIIEGLERQQDGTLAADGRQEMQFQSQVLQSFNGLCRDFLSKYPKANELSATDGARMEQLKEAVELSEHQLSLIR